MIHAFICSAVVALWCFNIVRIRLDIYSIFVTVTVSHEQTRTNNV